MQFTTRRRHGPPTVIIVSLIDVLIVVLIFLMVSTTFKQQPAVKLSLPESNQQRAGATADVVIVTIPKSGPLYFKSDPVTYEALQQKLKQAAAANPNVALTIRADTGSSVGQLVKVMDAAKQAHISNISLPVQNGGTL